MQSSVTVELSDPCLKRRCVVSLSLIEKSNQSLLLRVILASHKNHELVIILIFLYDSTFTKDYSHILPVLQPFQQD